MLGEAGNDIFEAEDGEVDTLIGGTGSDTANRDIIGVIDLWTE